MVLPLVNLGAAMDLEDMEMFVNAGHNVPVIRKSRRRSARLKRLSVGSLAVENEEVIDNCMENEHSGLEQKKKVCIKNFPRG